MRDTLQLREMKYLFVDKRSQAGNDVGVTYEYQKRIPIDTFVVIFLQQFRVIRDHLTQNAWQQ